MGEQSVPVRHSSGPAHRRLISGLLNRIAPIVLNSNVITASQTPFGAKGDGVANDATALQEAIDYAEAQSETTIIDLLGKTYRCDSQLTIDGSGVIFRNGGFDFSNASTGVQIQVSGAVGSTLSLNANADVGDETIVLSDASSLSANDFCVVDSGTVYWNTSNTTPITQQFRIASISTNTLTISEKLDYNFTTAANSDVRKLTFVENVFFENITLQGDSAISQTGISFNTCRNCGVHKLTSHDMTDRAIGSRDFSRDLLFDDITVFDSDRSGTGYGVAFGAGVEGSVVQNLTAYNTRHPVTMGGESALTRRCKAVDCYGYQGLSGFDMHPASDLCELINCHNTGTDTGSTSDDGMSIQGNRFTIKGCTIQGSPRHGALFQVLIDNLGGADSWGVAEDLVISDCTDNGLNASFTGGADLGWYSFQGVVKRPTEKAISIELNGPTIDSILIDFNAEASSASHQVVRVLATDTSGSQINNLTITGRYDHSSTTPNAIEVNGDSGSALEGVSLINARVDGGAHAIRTIDTDYTLVDQVRYKGQGTAFTNLAGSNNVIGSNISLP